MAEQTLNQKIIQWARGKVGKHVGKRECWDLADSALRSSGAQSSADLGPMDNDADYVWGTEVELKDVLPGDVLQYRDFEMKTTTVTETTFSDGDVESREETRTATYPHHTAIVSKNAGNGSLTVLEQNYLGKHEAVKAHAIWWKDASLNPVTTHKRVSRKDNKKTEQATVVVTVEVTVSGTVKAYRPLPK